MTLTVNSGWDDCRGDVTRDFLNANAVEWITGRSDLINSPPEVHDEPSKVLTSLSRLVSGPVNATRAAD